MSALARFLRPLPGSSRAYSSFFSSNSGGRGRYFTSAKVPKVVVTSKGAAPKAEPTTEPTADSAQASGTTASNGNSNTVVNAADKPSTASSQTSSNSASQASGNNGAPKALHTSIRASDALGGSTLLKHPIVNAKDFKLHQFFSLHRPLLLLPQPYSILESANASSFLPTEADEADVHSTIPQWLLDEFPEATADADAAAARQLTRAITMSQAGAAVSWDETLRRLGIDVDKERIGLQEIMMDSTKRKRRKKMKKHKLKKRRKATRSQRMKIGR